MCAVTAAKVPIGFLDCIDSALADSDYTYTDAYNDTYTYEDYASYT